MKSPQRTPGKEVFPSRCLRAFYEALPVKRILSYPLMLSSSASWPRRGCGRGRRFSSAVGLQAVLLWGWGLGQRPRNTNFTGPSRDKLNLLSELLGTVLPRPK
jgi:hypothetical protein